MARDVQYRRCMGCHLAKPRWPLCLVCQRRLGRERPDLEAAIHKAGAALTAAENAAAEYLSSPRNPPTTKSGHHVS